MRNILKVKAVGTLLDSRKWLSKKGNSYVRGRILCKTPSPLEFEFSCFNDAINERLVNENKSGERIKVIGNISNWQDMVTISIYRLVLANSVNDSAEFFAIGKLLDVRDEGELMTLVVESRNNFKGRDFSRELDITTPNTEKFREKAMSLMGRNILARGILRQISTREEDDEQSRIICWLNSLDVLAEKLKMERKDAVNEVQPIGSDKSSA